MLMILERINNFSENVPKRKTYNLYEPNAMFDIKYKRLGDFKREVV